MIVQDSYVIEQNNSHHGLEITMQRHEQRRNYISLQKHEAVILPLVGKISGALSI